MIKKTEPGSVRPHPADPGEVDYRSLAEFRYAIRKFLAFSETAAGEAGLTAQQHQAILTIKGLGEGDGLSVGELATRLLVRHHTAAELANRLEEAGLGKRRQDPNDGRRVLLALTPEGERRLLSLSSMHLDEIGLMAPQLVSILARLSGSREETAG